MQKPQAIIAQMDKLRVELMESIIVNIWKEDLWFFDIQEWINGIILSDLYISDANMDVIVTLEIQEDTCMEFFKYHEYWYTKDWIEQAKKEYWEGFLKTLFVFDNMRRKYV